MFSLALGTASTNKILAKFFPYLVSRYLDGDLHVRVNETIHVVCSSNRNHLADSMGYLHIIHTKSLLEFFREELLDLCHMQPWSSHFLPCLLIFVHDFLPVQLGSVTHRLLEDLQLVLEVLHVLADGHLNLSEEYLFIHHKLFPNIFYITFFYKFSI